MTPAAGLSEEGSKSGYLKFIYIISFGKRSLQDSPQIISTTTPARARVSADLANEKYYYRNRMGDLKARITIAYIIVTSFQRDDLSPVNVYKVGHTYCTTNFAGKVARVS